MGEKKKVLIVDDEVDFGFFLKLNLESTGRYEVRCEKNGFAGIKAAGEFKPDLILMDIAMPGLDGYQTAEQIRKTPSAKNTVVLFLTGKELLPESISEHCERFGQCDYIGKPFALDVLLGKIEELVK